MELSVLNSAGVPKNITETTQIALVKSREVYEADSVSVDRFMQQTVISQVPASLLLTSDFEPLSAIIPPLSQAQLMNCKLVFNTGDSMRLGLSLNAWSYGTLNWPTDFTKIKIQPFAFEDPLENINILALLPEIIITSADLWRYVEDSGWVWYPFFTIETFGFKKIGFILTELIADSQIGITLEVYSC